jgi:HEXXH motif-containing protein
MVISPAQVESDVEAVARYAGVEGSGDVGWRYREALNRIQPYPLRSPSGARAPALTFDLGDDRTIAIVDSLMSAEDLAGSERPRELAPGERQSTQDGVDAGFELLTAYSPSVSRMIRCLLRELLVIDAPGLAAGSFWQILGMIWISPTPPWSPSQYAETLLHEGTHQATFLHDMVHGLFSVPNAELSSDSALITSPIRKVARPYDFAFHAAVVSATLIEYFRGVGDEGSAEPLVEPLELTLSELESKSRFLSPSGIAILNEMLRGAASQPAWSAAGSASAAGG